MSAVWSRLTNSVSPAALEPVRSSASSCTYGGRVEVAEGVAERLDDTFAAVGQLVERREIEVDAARCRRT